MGRELLTSAQNPKVKRLLALQKDSALRRETGLFVVEGRRELRQCLDAGYELDSIFVCPKLYGPLWVQDFGPIAAKSAQNSAMGPASGTSSGDGGAGVLGPGTVAARGRVNGRGPQIPEGRSGRDERSEVPGPNSSRTGVFEVSPELYEKIAYRGGTEGVIAEVRAKSFKLSELELPKEPLVIVLESVEKPGNLGAVLRSADAAGADALLVCDPLTDLFNPNLIRASIGACFTVPTVACSSAEAIAFLQQRGIQIITAQLQDSLPYYGIDLRRGSALIMGTESTGLSQAWRDAATAHVRIPMLGRLDSLNVSVSAAILLFEAVRQRQTQGV